MNNLNDIEPMEMPNVPATNKKPVDYKMYIILALCGLIVILLIYVYFRGGSDNKPLQEVAPVGKSPPAPANTPVQSQPTITAETIKDLRGAFTPAPTTPVQEETTLAPIEEQAEEEESETDDKIVN